MNTIRVLHVDDEPSFGDLVSDFLQMEDDRIEVISEISVGDGLSRIESEQERIDCIVSDYDMPGQNGIEFLQSVRDEWPDIPFILFTGKGGEAVASEAISTGVTDYLQKSNGTEQYELLANRIRNAVELKQAQRERQRNLDAIETAREGIALFNHDGELVYVNEAFADIYRYDPEEMIGEHWELIYREEDYPLVHEEILPTIEEKGHWRGETIGIRADGTTFLEDHRLVSTDGSELICTVQDISERKEREQELQQTSARLEALFENSPDMINIHDKDGNIITPNPRLCEKTGYDASELTEMKVWELDQAINSDKAYDFWEETEIGESRRLNGVYQRRDGSTFPVEVHIRRINFEGTDRFVAIARDISERKERQQDLVKYERIIEYLDDIATIIEPDGTITYVSPSVKRVLGYDPEELIGENGFGYQPETTAEAVADAIEYVIENPSQSQTIQTKFRKKDGSFCWIESTLRNQVEDDVIEGILVSSRDITERKMHQEQLERQNKRLDQFASIVSHDLRNPLNVAQGRLELAQEEYTSPHLDTIGQAQNRMEALIEDVLTLAHQENRINETDPVDLAEVVEICWQNVKTADARVDIDVGRTIEADQSQLAQLFENLIRNAIEHGGEDVTVSIGELDDGFYVEDDGPGIPAENRNEVFDVGYSTAKEGTGFGLSIVNQVADAHGWNIHVTEGTEGGARFEITGIEFAE